MKVLLVDIDQTKYPNLALMKLSKYHKLRKDVIGFNISNPDKVYISTVFSWNRWKAESSKFLYEKIFNIKVEVGGSGYSYDIVLPNEIEYLMPDYDLYNIDYAMGFTSRGCIRRCQFCIVPIKEGFIRHVQNVWEFVPDDFNKVILMDNNLLASPKWKEQVEWLIDKNIKVSFNQGLDIRLINEDNAKLIAETKYYDYKFNVRTLYFAWDYPQIERLVMRGIKYLLDAGVKPHHMLFYILTGFNTTIEQDLYRVKKLKSMGVMPYVMIYNKYENKYSKELSKLQKWVNRRYYQFIDWDDFEVSYRSKKAVGRIKKFGNLKRIDDWGDINEENS